ncbi:hypothetical protein DE146DRAFT_49591 [Phaeosphaeria sp. MPI-PUGE-AT-0046c]|nr:hypothetical protein DE146DRAFT_49591 [Phaeosphaeria sp. MPI-PUGE-AT-0046c]
MADIKALKDAVWLKKEAIKKEEQGLNEWTSQKAQMDEMIELGDTSEELNVFREEAVKYTAMHEATLARLRPELAELEAQLPQAPQPAAAKYDVAKHPKMGKPVEKQEPEMPVSFNTGDTIEAQWTDRAWYKAKIRSILGSASAPKYLVKFIEYDESITVDSTAVRPLPSKRKREPEPAAVANQVAPVTSTPHVISGPAFVNPNAQVAQKDISDEEAGKKKSRIANKGQLKKRQSNWQDWQAKKGGKKDSMFRTSSDAGSRVGFTGSGKGMTETHKRKRYDHKADVENDVEYNESAPQNRKRFQ